MKLKIHFECKTLTLLDIAIHLGGRDHFAHLSQSRPLLAQLLQMTDAGYLILLERLHELVDRLLPVLNLPNTVRFLMKISLVYLF